MASTPNYRETTVSGDQWTRAQQVIINNPLNETPNISFVEMDVTNINGRIIMEQSGILKCQFSAEDPLHVELYNKLNDLYVILRELRDAESGE